MQAVTVIIQLQIAAYRTCNCLLLCWLVCNTHTALVKCHSIVETHLTCILQDTLRQSGLLDFYPYLARQLTNQSGQEQQQQQQSSPGTSYLNYVSLLNQVVMMGTQLYNDAVTPAHHKYAAHQIALLYVSNQLPGTHKHLPYLLCCKHCSNIVCCWLHFLFLPVTCHLSCTCHQHACYHHSLRQCVSYV